ncbi:MAG: hypothetical protein HZB44_00325 [Actinobacteria bacterium]|nr:hypothetical protein [Actinomycetota bacterium]
MTIELVIFIFFAMALGPVVITLVYCGFRGCNGAGEPSRETDVVKDDSEQSGSGS